MLTHTKCFCQLKIYYYFHFYELTNLFCGVIIMQGGDNLDTLGKRFQLIRKELGMTGKELGEKLGVGRDVINNIENDRLKKPDQKEPLFKLFCQMYNVSYPWLMKGIGKPILNVPSTLIDDIAKRFNLDNEMKLILTRFLELTPDEREVVKKLFAPIQKKENEQ